MVRQTDGWSRCALRFILVIKTHNIDCQLSSSTKRILKYSCSTIDVFFASSGVNVCEDKFRRCLGGSAGITIGLHASQCFFFYSCIVLHFLNRISNLLVARGPNAAFAVNASEYGRLQACK